MGFFRVEKTVLKALILALALSAAPFFAAAEPFRVHRTNIISISSPFDRQSAEAGVNDVVAIMLPEDTVFIEGIEISIKVPQIVAEWRDSVAWSLYSGIQPQPAHTEIDYSGTRMQTGTFGESLSLNIKVPITKEHSIKEDAYSVLAQLVPAQEGGFLFLRLQLAMKGVPGSITKTQFTVSAHPILSKKGILSLDALPPEEGERKPLTVFLDGKQSELGKKSVIVPAGKHDISLVSDFYRNELRTVTVEQAKRTEVSVQLRDIKPIVRLIAPQETRMFFDETEYIAPAEQFYTTQGDHTVKFFVGDYEIVKTLSAANGRSYSISVNIDASITETE